MYLCIMGMRCAVGTRHGASGMKRVISTDADAPWRVPTAAMHKYFLFYL